MSRVTFLAILLLAAAGAPAQQPEAEKPGVKISAEMLINLHQAGLGKDHIIKVLDHNGVPTLSDESLKAVKAAGLPQEIVQRLEQAANQPGKKPLTIQSIVQMVRAGVATETIILTIKSSEATFELTPQEVVDLIINQKVPGDVVKAMTATRTEKSAPTKIVKMVSLDDIARYTAAGMTIEWILNQIRQTNSRFDATPDDLIRLSRKDVHADVLGEIWNRTPRNKTADPTPARPTEEAAKKPKPAASAIAYRDHVDEGLGFSLSVPDGWPVHKERKGPNDLLSFSDKSLPPDGGLADQEIQVARFRASHPERLTDTNLLPIARNFINALRNNFQTRGVTMTSEEAGRTWLSGRSAVAWRVTTTMKDGPTLQGRVLVTWDPPYVYMLSYATRSELPDQRRQALARCVQSFTIEKPAQTPTPHGTEREQLTTLFETWRAAIQKRDFVTYRSLHGGDVTAKDARLHFVDLGTQFTVPDRRIALGDVRTDVGELKVTYRIIDPNSTAFGLLEFQRTRQGLRIAPSK